MTGTPVLFLVLILLCLLPAASTATELFDPEPIASFGPDSEIVRSLQDAPIWDRIDLYADYEDRLLRQELFTEQLEWKEDDEWAPHIKDAFGTSTPSSERFLLHYGFSWDTPDTNHQTPVLFVHGAVATASYSWTFFSYYLSYYGYSTFALTYAHPQGDNYMQAEHIANAIQKIKELTGAEQVDVVAHSKGGVAARIYASNEGFDWGRDGDAMGTAYRDYGTPYRGDVRRLVLLGAPSRGQDAVFRWSASNYYAVNPSPHLMSPVSWQTYYPFTTAWWWISQDLSEEDVFKSNGDYFPGQAQLLSAFDDAHDLPGLNPSLGLYAFQQDWFTTYYGGYGLYSHTSGLEAAKAEGGHLIEKLNEAGVSPGVEVAVGYGTYPLLSQDLGPVLLDIFGNALGAFLGQSIDFYSNFITECLSPFFPNFILDDDTFYGITSGKLLFGEISGPSDGVTFASSTSDLEGITARGAPVLAHCAFELNHLDLVMAVRETGEYMIELGNEDPEHNRHMRSIGRRYIDNDIYAWTRGILGFDPGYPWDGSMLGCRTPHILEKPRPPEGTSKREWGSVLERRESGETPAEFIIRLDPVPRADRLAFPDHR